MPVETVVGYHATILSSEKFIIASYIAKIMELLYYKSITFRENFF